MDRRKFITMSAGACLPGISYASNKSEDVQKLVDSFMKQFRAPGLSVAFAHKGKMIFSKAYGHANTEKNELLDVSHLFRIASISKPITATAIFSLVESNKIKLSDLVFNKEGILDYSGPKGMTVEHLLNHTCGGWSNSGERDPMFIERKFNHDELIKWVIKNVKLKNKPGEKYAYSNFGYCLLGRIIEKVSSQNYTDFVSQNILNKCGITKMKIGLNKLGKGEVTYYDDLKKAI